LNSASRCAGVARSSMTTVPSPCPWWMAPGQANMPTTFSPSSFTSLKWPSSMRMATAARQLPCEGSALNWHGQPHSQLQAPISRPLMLQST
jgi:hypothetical protein